MTPAHSPPYIQWPINPPHVPHKISTTSPQCLRLGMLTFRPTRPRGSLPGLSYINKFGRPMSWKLSLVGPTPAPLPCQIGGDFQRKHWIKIIYLHDNPLLAPIGFAFYSHAVLNLEYCVGIALSYSCPKWICLFFSRIEYEHFCSFKLECMCSASDKDFVRMKVRISNCKLFYSGYCLRKFNLCKRS